ncbi:MAG: undecaprenyl-diphosphate phosphatase [Verrucomicrobiales bacterium]|nr:undecaprenyl-diphosphate phosphatase [Verrucomicrobiales bacterium]
MPDWLQVIILGIIEGITEFLPISSTGHLLLVEQWLPETMFEDDGARERFMVFIQSGAVLAVIAVFKERVRELITQWRQTEVRDYLIKMIVTFLITAVGGLALKAAGWELPNNSVPIAWALLIGGVLFIVIEQRNVKTKNAEKENGSLATISWTIAVAFGLAQLVAMVFPGASRSGTTILIGMALGMRRGEAVEYSFLLGVPTLLAAGIYQLMAAISEDGSALVAEASRLTLGTVVSAITAFAAVKWLLSYLQKNTFIVFGWYRIGLGILILLIAAKHTIE